MNIEFDSKSKEIFVFRALNVADNEKLGCFFESLSTNTRSKFGPHPLTKKHAFILCDSIDTDNVCRYVILHANEIVGYFILDFNTFENEAVRYSKFGIELDSKIDPVFAPCIADKYQNAGIASQAMKIILDIAKSKNLRRIVLMGGTQKSNSLAQSFYKKFGFEEFGEFYTEHNGLNNIDMMLTLKRK